MKRSVLLLAAASLLITVGIVRDKLRWQASVDRSSDAALAAHSYGIEYESILARARRGDRQALTQFLNMTLLMDGAAAEEHCDTITQLLDDVGDERFVAVLERLGQDARLRVAEALSVRDRSNLKATFPRTCAVTSSTIEKRR